MHQIEKLETRVSKKRWEAAQIWERNHWVREQKELAKYGKNILYRLLAFFGFVEKYRGDDRNHWWHKEFDEYNFLPSKVNNALEVGCGPYTNMRLIINRCKPSHLYLSDPLIRSYIKFKNTFVSQMWKEAACCFDDHPLESLPFADDYFDLSVMINVLDHVRDANASVNNLIRVTCRGGIVVIGQDLTNEDDLAKHPNGLKKGHPVTLDYEWFIPYMEKFDEVFKRIVPREDGWASKWHYGTLVFAGRKR